MLSKNVPNPYRTNSPSTSKQSIQQAEHDSKGTGETNVPLRRESLEIFESQPLSSPESFHGYSTSQKKRAHHPHQNRRYESEKTKTLAKIKLLYNVIVKESITRNKSY